MTASELLPNRLEDRSLPGVVHDAAKAMLEFGFQLGQRFPAAVPRVPFHEHGGHAQMAEPADGGFIQGGSCRKHHHAAGIGHRFGQHHAGGQFFEHHTFHARGSFSAIRLGPES